MFKKSFTESISGNRTDLLAQAKKYHRNFQISLVLLLISLIGGLTFGVIIKKGAEKAVNNPFPLVDFSRSFIAQEHFIGTLQPLREDLTAIAKRASEKGITVSVYMEFFNTGANISINSEERIFPASLMKLPIALAAMEKIQDGGWRPDDELVLMPDDMDKNSGELYKNPVGTKFSIESLIQAVLKQSDNTAYKILLRNLESSELNALLEHLGLADFFNELGQISSKEYSRLFRSLYSASYLNRENSQKFLEWLVAGSFKEFLSSGLPKDVTFSHKYGQNNASRVFSDSGIVYLPNRPYLLTVLIHPNAIGANDADFEEIKGIMKEISAKTFKYISEY